MEIFRLAIHEPDIHSLPNLKTATTATNSEQGVRVCVWDIWGGGRGQTW